VQPTPTARNEHGFTLVELAIVLIIVALLTGGLLLGVSAQRNAAENIDAQRQLESIREALLGFAISRGRLPCPALPNLPNGNAAAGIENCTQPHGVLPWATLGLPETDPWGNRFTYFAHASFTAAVTPPALASFTLDTVGNANVKDTWNSGANSASDLPAVIVSHGSRSAGAYQPTGAQLLPVSTDPNEAENSDADTTFVSRTPGSTFDDLVTWIVPSILKAKMVAAGRLP
jgi:prepilin-type N-terminal cleavage/methylation domain-containing protein